MRFIFFLFTIFLHAPSHAGVENAYKLRQAIEQSSRPKTNIAREYKLPVSRAFWQGDSALCWVYAFLSAQETLQLLRSPDAPLELSRAAFQVHTMQDRVTRSLTGIEDVLSELGTPMDAFYLAKRFGFVAFDDYRDIMAEAATHYWDVWNAASQGRNREERAELLNQELIRLFGGLPTKTLGQDLLKGQDWVAYAPSSNEGRRRHPDPDARRGTLAQFIKPHKLKALIRYQLEAGQPMTYTAHGHVIMLYGAKYDAQGEPVTFYMKDSYPPFFYEAEPEWVLRDVVEMTMLKTP